MKKLSTTLLALLLLASAAMAQNHSRRIPMDKKARTHFAGINKRTHAVSPTANRTTKAVGDTVNVFPWTEGFETGVLPAGFTTYDNDGDGYNWDPTLIYNPTSNYGHNESHGAITSASYINGIGVLTPDNWMILPTIDMTAETNPLRLTWFDKGWDPTYCNDFYSVYISTSGRSISDFDTLNPVFSTTSAADWTKKSIDLTPYAGQTINIAFRHHNSIDIYYLVVDDIKIAPIGTPEITLTGPSFINIGDTAQFVVHDALGCTLNWTVDADYTQYEDSILYAVWDNVGTYTVAVEAVNAFGSDSSSLSLQVVNCETITSFPFFEGFESPNPCWTVLAIDPENDNELGVAEFEDAIEGSSAFTFSSYNRASDYNQFLITPQLLLPNDGYMLKFYYYAESFQESFRVLASSTGNAPEDFTTVLGNIIETVEEEFTEVAFAIPANTKYLAINYYGTYAYYLYIDNLTIEPLTVPTITISGPEEIGTGIEATFTATSTLSESFSWKIDGVPSPETGNILTHTFTTVGNHTVSVMGSNSIGNSAPAVANIDVFNCDGITVPYHPDFSEGLMCWVNRSDGDQGYGWFPSFDMFEDGSEGLGQVYSMSAVDFLGMGYIDIDADNWLTSPLISMPETGSYDIAWKVMPYLTDRPGDHYSVYVIDNNGEQRMLFEESLNSAMNGFENRRVVIPNDINGQFRIAFRHHDNQNGFVIILDDIKVVEHGTESIYESTPNNISVYPNPANSNITVDGDGILSVELLDINGRTVTSAAAGNIDISSLPCGIYLVRIITAEGTTTTKIVKK